MANNIDEMQRLGKDNMDATIKSFGALSKSMQAIAVESRTTPGMSSSRALRRPSD